MLRGVDISSAAWKVGAVSGALAVGLGAFGAHGLQKAPHVIADPKLLETWKTASQYHLVHSVAMLAAAAHPRAHSALLFGVGNVLFAGSLYALVLTERRWLGAVTPLGGLAYIGGWLALLL